MRIKGELPVKVELLWDGGKAKLVATIPLPQYALDALPNSPRPDFIGDLKNYLNGWEPKYWFQFKP